MDHRGRFRSLRSGEENDLRSSVVRGEAPVSNDLSFGFVDVVLNQTGDASTCAVADVLDVVVLDAVPDVDDPCGHVDVDDAPAKIREDAILEVPSVLVSQFYWLGPLLPPLNTISDALWH